MPSSKQHTTPYKQTPIGLLPKHWEVKKLGDIGSIKMCKRIFNEETSELGEIPFYKIGTFGKVADAYITKEKYNEYRSKYPYPKKGAILISAAGTLGRKIIFKGEESYFQDSNIVWLDNDEKQLGNEMLYYYYDVLKFDSEGGTIQRLYNSIILNAKIPIPPLPEQQRIARILSTWDKAIENVKNIIEQLQLRNKGLAQALLTGKKRVKGFEGSKWEIKKLREAGEVINGLTYSPDDVDDDGVLVLRSSNIQNGIIDLNNCVYVHPDNISFNPVIENDILICVRNGSRNLIGKNLLISKFLEGVAFGAFMSVFRSEIYFYIIHLFASELYYKEVEKNLGATINSINNSDLLNYKFPFPEDYEELKTISNILSVSTTELIHYQQKLQQLQIQKKGLMQQLLTGKVLTLKY